MTQETTIQKNNRGLWQAETKFPLRKNADGSTLMLSFFTMKRSSGAISTTASVSKETQHEGYSSNQHTVFEDYMKTVHLERATATEKNVLRIHNEGLEWINMVMEEVKAQYHLKEKVDA